jgi:hypothetical protein
MFNTLNLSPLLSHPVFLIEVESLRFFISDFHLASCFVLDLLQGILWDPLIDQLFTVDISDWLHRINDFVHQRLGEGGLVKFVMAEFPITDQIDDNITLELLTELSGELERSLDILHTVGVDVENGSVDGLGNIS